MIKKLMILYYCVIILCIPAHVVVADSSIDLSEKVQSNLKVHFIDVGQGDSALIETPNGKHILIDGGPPSASSKLFEYLDEHDVTSIDLLIVTHPDLDHIGGLLPIFKKYNVKEIMDSGKMYYSLTYFRYLNEIRKQDIPVNIASLGEVIKLDKNISLKVLNTADGKKDNNESSIVLSLSYKQVKFLFMADVEKKQEMEIAKRFDVDADIIKAGHHGSKTSSSIDFLKKVKPSIAILSYSKDNDYGHPVAATIDHLLDSGATIFSTAKVGDIVITTNGFKYDLHSTGKDHVVLNKPVNLVG